MPHVVEDVPEHLAVPVDEVVLLQGVQHDGDGTVKQARQLRVGEPARKNNSFIQNVICTLKVITWLKVIS